MSRSKILLAVAVVAAAGVGMRPSCPADLNLEAQVIQVVPNAKSKPGSSFRVVDPEMLSRAPKLEKKDLVYSKFPPVVIESHKLIFFDIPKIGSSEWKSFFLKMRGINVTEFVQLHGTSVHDQRVNGLKLLSDYSLEEANRVLTSPDYTRAIFVRDPKERFLSAYLDKSLGRKGKFMYMQAGKKGCCDKAEDPRECMSKAISSFPSFYNLVEGGCNNPHWSPQSERIDEKYWSLIDFVGHLETAAADAETLLKRIGLWEEFGKTGWGADGSLAFFQRSPDPKRSHTTNAKEKLQKYYTPGLESAVESWYSGDYSSPYMNYSMTKIF